jgi:hypothetical protein
MNLDFINRVIRTSLIIIIIAFPFAAIYIRLAFAVSILLGCLWGCADLLAIKLLITSFLGGRTRSVLSIILILFVKFPLLYFLGYLLVKWSYLSVYGLLWGFSAIFLITVLKVISRSILKLDSKPAKVL